MNVGKAFRDGLTGLGLLATANAASAQDEKPKDEKPIPDKHRVSYAHQFLDYDSPLGSGHGYRDILGLRLEPAEDIGLNMLFSRTRYSGTGVPRCETATSDGFLPGDDDDGGLIDYDRHRRQRGRGHESHGRGHGYGHHGSRHGDDGDGTGISFTDTRTTCDDHYTGIEHALEIGPDFKLGNARLDLRFLYSDNLDAQHLFTPDDIEGFGLAAKLGIPFDDATGLELEARLMGIEGGGAITAERIGLTHRLGARDWLGLDLSARQDDLRGINFYGLGAAWRHDFGGAAARFGAGIGYEDVEYLPGDIAWNASAALEVTIRDGVVIDFGLNYEAGLVDHATGSVGITLKW